MDEKIHEINLKEAIKYDPLVKSSLKNKNEKVIKLLQTSGYINKYPGDNGIKFEPRNIEISKGEKIIKVKGTAKRKPHKRVIITQDLDRLGDKEKVSKGIVTTDYKESVKNMNNYITNLNQTKEGKEILKFERGTHVKLVTVHGKTKTFQRKQRVGTKDKKVTIKTKSDEDKKAEWAVWQQYYKDELFRPSASPHEDYYSQAILAASSPQHAKALIRKFQVKDPSSMGVDLAGDFERLYNQTKDKVPKKVKKSSLHPDNFQIIDEINDSNIPGLVGGIHEMETYICRFKDGSQSIYKTMLPGDIVGEVGAYEISKILGWDIVPETIQANYNKKGEGSSQKWIEDGREPTDDFIDGVDLKEKHFNDLSKIFVMDMINSNFDRHSGNIIISQDKVYAIDNEMWGKKDNAELHIESLDQYAKKGEGSPMPMIRVLENSIGSDIKLWQKFKDHVDKNIGIAILHKDEIMNYWNKQISSDVKASGVISSSEAVGYIQKNIKYLENYYESVLYDKEHPIKTTKSSVRKEVIIKFLNIG
jgi:uncharacterized cupredoxin-like copper-binding protein